MKFSPLGRSALQVSRLAVGTANFGWVTGVDESRAALDRALDLGVNLIDTADSYNWAAGDRRTECILGDWFRARPGARDRVVLATKVFGTVGDGPNDGGLSAWHIRRACDDSLRRLRTDRIDLYQLHHIDRRAHWEEVWEAMDRLIRAGKVLYAGSSNFAGWHIAAAQAVAHSRGGLGLVSEQSVYHLAGRTVELEVVPACVALGIGVLAYAPLAGGLLAANDGVGVRRAEAVQQADGPRRDQLARYWELCLDIGATPAAVALAWLFHRPGVTAAVLGPRTVEQLESAAAAVDLHLSELILGKLDAIWPGPGTAPEAYAW